MNWSLFVTILIGAASILFMLLQYRISHGERSDKRLRERVVAFIAEDMSAEQVVERITRLEVVTGKDSREREHEILRGMLAETLSPVGARLATLETKIDVYWRSVSMDSARILHQPDPKRRQVDLLLEAFMDGSITDDQRLELRKYLYLIRNWEPEQDPGFPVHPGEQVAAAILLRTMDYVIEQSRKGAKTGIVKAQ